MTVWFTSDTHYYHANIIRYSKRPYKDVDEMNNMLIANFNSKVQPGDTVYHLGDFGFADQQKLKNVVQRLNGDKHLILGNHDRFKEALGMGWGSVNQYRRIKVDDPDAKGGVQLIVLLHYAMRVWDQSHRGSWQLYGHSHGTLPDDPNLLSMDVGVDPCGYFPISYEEVKKKMKRKTWQSVDHHK